MKRKIKAKEIENEQEIGSDKIGEYNDLPEPDEIDEYKDLPELIEIDDDEVWNRDSLRKKYFVDIVRTPKNGDEFEIQQYLGIKRIQYVSRDGTYLAHNLLVIMYKAKGIWKKPPYIAIVQVDYRNWHPMILNIKLEEIPPKTRVRLTATGEVITKVEIIPKSEDSSVR